MSFPSQIRAVCATSLIPGEVVLFDEKHHLPELGLILPHESMPAHLEGDTGTIRAEDERAHAYEIRKPPSAPCLSLLSRNSAMKCT